MVTAHWETDGAIEVTTAAKPGLLYDYYGFPPETYAPHLTYDAPGEPALATRIVGMLQKAGISVRGNDKREFDHGTFIPLKVRGLQLSRSYWLINGRTLCHLPFSFPSPLPRPSYSR